MESEKALEAALGGQASKMRCCEQALLEDPSLGGRIGLLIRVGWKGQVCLANVIEDDITHPTIASCVAGLFWQAGSPPPPTTRCVDVNLPIILKRR
ncbi:hypothetical protein [Pajaroellobacter abortibovis]|uniref:hypothetical protein n=1 Tax=Pajaroellobacter abortibovis TaxID=1882918 RepID=UPI00155F5845|nr:hypothetical protein [Pajaroellobacter abortibovis]